MRRRVVVVAAVIEKAYSILLTQRRADQTFPLHWEFPGGKIELGESPAQALRREIREEIGCRIRVGDLAEVVYHAYSEFDLVMPLFWATILGGTPQPVQVAKVAWVKTASLLRRKMPPADVPFARALSRNRR